MFSVLNLTLGSSLNWFLYRVRAIDLIWFFCRRMSRFANTFVGKAAIWFRVWFFFDRFVKSLFVHVDSSSCLLLYLVYIPISWWAVTCCLWCGLRSGYNIVPLVTSFLHRTFLIIHGLHSSLQCLGVLFSISEKNISQLFDLQEFHGNNRFYRFHLKAPTFSQYWFWQLKSL